MSPSFTSLPIIDIGALVEKFNDPSFGKNEDVMDVVRQIDHVCKDIGFFYVIGHGVRESLVESVRNVSREFFHQDFEDKIQIKMNRKGYRGYQEMRENVTKGKRDRHEAIDYYKDIEPGQYGDLGAVLCAPNQWPQYPLEFQSVMEEYIEAMLGLSRKLLSGIALALGGSLDSFDGEKAGDPFWVMRVIGYPPAPHIVKGNSINDEDDGIGCGAHTDYGLLTLVNQDSDVCALQVKNQSGDWINAIPVKGAFVVNIGDMLKIWSNGLYQSTLHQVINNSPKYRISVPFFLEPNFDAVVEPLKFCKIKPASDEEIKPVIYGEHLVNKVLNNFY